MPGNSQRQGAVRRRGKGNSGRGNTAGSGGRIRRSLEGKGPTPKAEDRPNHKAYKQKLAREKTAPSRSGTRARSSGAEWVVGRNPVLEVVQAGIPIKALYLAEGAEKDNRLRDILSRAADTAIPLLQVTRGELDRMTAQAVHQGVAVQLPEFAYAHSDDVLHEALTQDAPVVVALDHVTDPRNLGAIVRSAAAFGASGVLIPERRSAQMSAAAWKTSAGAAVRVPIARVTNLNRSLKSFADAGFTIVGLAGDADLELSQTPDITGPVVLVVGSEGDGLSRLVRQHCDHLVAIPIAADVESLNASVAAGIALYELARTHSTR